MLTPSPAITRVLETGNIAGTCARMNYNAGPGCHPRNDTPEQLLAANKIGIDDARNATTDRIGFA